MSLNNVRSGVSFPFFFFFYSTETKCPVQNNSHPQTESLRKYFTNYAQYVSHSEQLGARKTVTLSWGLFLCKLPQTCLDATILAPWSPAVLTGKCRGGGRATCQLQVAPLSRQRCCGDGRRSWSSGGHSTVGLQVRRRLVFALLSLFSFTFYAFVLHIAGGMER